MSEMPAAIVQRVQAAVRDAVSTYRTQTKGGPITEKATGDILFRGRPSARSLGTPASCSGQPLCGSCWRRSSRRWRRTVHHTRDDPDAYAATETPATHFKDRLRT